MQREGLWMGRPGPACRVLTVVRARHDGRGSLAVACDHGVFLSRDGATTWQRILPGRAGGAVAAVVSSTDATAPRALESSSRLGGVTDMAFWNGRLAVATDQGLFVQQRMGSFLVRPFLAIGRHRVARLAGGGRQRLYAAVGRRIWVSRNGGGWARLDWLAPDHIAALAVGPGRRSWLVAGPGHSICVSRDLGRHWHCLSVAGRVLDLAWFGPQGRRLAVLTTLGLLFVDPVWMQVRARYRAVWAQRLAVSLGRLWVFGPGAWLLGPTGRWQQIEAGFAGPVQSMTSNRSGRMWAVDGAELYSLSRVAVRRAPARSPGWCREAVSGPPVRLPRWRSTYWMPDLTLGAWMRKQPRTRGLLWGVLLSLRWTAHLHSAQQSVDARWRVRLWARRRRMRKQRLVTACRRLERLWVLGDLSVSQRVWVRSQARRIRVLMRGGA
ncbi:MAG: hypothetical protein J7M25_02935 [Deltaproteobacteria bacterium]|nr:hypothetical protein [Deltaproteobacteria bacterium]